MDYLKKVKFYLEMLKFKKTSIKINPTTFSWENTQNTNKNEIMTEFVLPEEFVQLTLYQKYARIKNEPKEKYSNLFSSPEYEWKLIATFCSRFILDEYEDKEKGEKLIATPYAAITEEQYQALLDSKKRKSGYKR